MLWGVNIELKIMAVWGHMQAASFLTSILHYAMQVFQAGILHTFLELSPTEHNGTYSEQTSIRLHC